MPTRKMRIELFDGEGNRYTVSIEGQINREKALRLLDMAELLGGFSTGIGNSEDGVPIVKGEFTKYGKVRAIIQKNFPVVWFSSREVQSVYEQELKEPASLSTIATYLARMTNKGFLMRTGSFKNLKYRLTPSFPQAMIKQQKF